MKYVYRTWASKYEHNEQNRCLDKNEITDELAFLVNELFNTFYAISREYTVWVNWRLSNRIKLIVLRCYESQDDDVAKMVVRFGRDCSYDDGASPDNSSAMYK